LSSREQEDKVSDDESNIASTARKEGLVIVIFVQKRIQISVEDVAGSQMVE